MIKLQKMGGIASQYAGAAYVVGMLRPCPIAAAISAHSVHNVNLGGDA